MGLQCHRSASNYAPEAFCFVDGVLGHLKIELLKVIVDPIPGA